MDKVGEIMRKITRVIACLILCLSFVLPMAVMAADIEQAKTISTSHVLDDLNSLPAEEFDITQYPHDATGKIKPSTIYFVESGFTLLPEYEDLYGLYVYVYNPTAAPIQLEGNTIQLATAFSGDTAIAYDSFEMRLVSVSDSALFYKFKVLDRAVNDKTFYERQIGKEKRIYECSGITLNYITEGKKELKECAFRYEYTGYAKGLSHTGNDSDTLKCVGASGTESIELTVKDTSWLAEGYSSLGEGHYAQLHSVWFTVPKRYIDAYGSLQKVKAQWIEQRTRPIVIIDTGVENGIVKSAAEFSALNNNTRWAFFTGAKRSTLDYASGYYTYQGGMTGSGWLYAGDTKRVGYSTLNTGAFFYAADEYNELAYKGNSLVGLYEPAVFYNFPFIVFERQMTKDGKKSDDINDFVIQGSELKSAISSFGTRDVYWSGVGTLSVNYFGGDGIFDGRMTFDNTTIGFGGLQVHEIDASDKITVTSDKHITYTWGDNFWQKLCGKDGIIQSTSYNIEGIVQVTSDSFYGSDKQISDRLFVAQHDLAELKADVQAAETNGDYVFLFRFCLTDFKADKMLNSDGEEISTIKLYKTVNSDAEKFILRRGVFDDTNNVYTVEQNVFLDFDIISLTFNNNGVQTVIPVVMDPVDIYPDINMEQVYDDNKDPPKDDGINWFLIILVLIVAVLILIFLMPILWPLISAALPVIGFVLKWALKAVIWVIAFPFNVIGSLIKKARSSEDDNNYY